MIDIKNNKSAESGRLLAEFLLVMGLLLMLLPFLYKKLVTSAAESEDMAIAMQMRSIRDGISDYIQTNYNAITLGHTIGNVVYDKNGGTFTVALDDPEVLKYMTHKDFSLEMKDNLAIAIRVDRSGTSGAATAKNAPMYSISAMVVNKGLDSSVGDKRLSRIAQYIGSGGGFIHSDKWQQSRGTPDQLIVYDSQGLWQYDTQQYFPVGGPTTLSAGKVVAMVNYADPEYGLYLFRRAVDGDDEGEYNTMHTDLDMNWNRITDIGSIRGRSISIYDTATGEVKTSIFGQFEADADGLIDKSSNPEFLTCYYHPKTKVTGCVKTSSFTSRTMLTGVMTVEDMLSAGGEIRTTKGSSFGGANKDDFSTELRNVTLSGSTRDKEGHLVVGPAEDGTKGQVQIGNISTEVLEAKGLRVDGNMTIDSDIDFYITDPYTGEKRSFVEYEKENVVCTIYRLSSSEYMPTDKVVTVGGKWMLVNFCGGSASNCKKSGRAAFKNKPGYEYNGYYATCSCNTGKLALCRNAKGTSFDCYSDTTGSPTSGNWQCRN